MDVMRTWRERSMQPLRPGSARHSDGVSGLSESSV